MIIYYKKYLQKGSAFVNHIMIDLEMNKVKRQCRGDKKLSSELIEIGAVKMNSEFEPIDQYQTYVMPSFGRMDSKITELTGITDAKLAGAPCFEDAMKDFDKWIGEEDAIFYSWSMSDIRQFLVESDFKSFVHPMLKRMKENWIDFQEEYSKLLGIEKKIKLKQAVMSADYEFTGAQHTALADAVNTAEILRLSKHPDEFERVMKPLLDLFRPSGAQATLFDMCPEFFESVLGDMSVSHDKHDN